MVYIPKRKKQRRLDLRSGQSVPMSPNVPAEAYTYNALSKVLDTLADKTIPAILSFNDKEAKLKSELGFNNWVNGAREKNEKLVAEMTLSPEEYNQQMKTLEEDLKESEWATGYDGVYAAKAKSELSRMRAVYNQNYIKRKYPALEKQSFENLKKSFDVDTQNISIRDTAKYDLAQINLEKRYKDNVKENLELRVGKDNVTKQMLEKEFNRPLIKAQMQVIQKEIRDKALAKSKQALTSEIDSGDTSLPKLNKFLQEFRDGNISEKNPTLRDQMIEFEMITGRLSELGFSQEEIYEELNNFKNKKINSEIKSDTLKRKNDQTSRRDFDNEGDVIQSSLVLGLTNSNKPFLTSDGQEITSLPELNNWKISKGIEAETKTLSTLRESGNRVLLRKRRLNLRNKINKKLDEDSNYYGRLSEGNKSFIQEKIKLLDPNASDSDVSKEANFLVSTFNKMSRERRSSLKEFNSSLKSLFDNFDLQVTKNIKKDKTRDIYEGKIDGLQLSILEDARLLETKITDPNNFLTEKQSDDLIKKFYFGVQKKIHKVVRNEVDELLESSEQMLPIRNPLYEIKQENFLLKNNQERKNIIREASLSLLEIAKDDTLKGKLKKDAPKALTAYSLLNILEANPENIKDATRSLALQTMDSDAEAGAARKAVSKATKVIAP